MRKALLLAAAMLMVFSGVASAARSAPAMVVGHYSYDFSAISGIPGDTRTVTLLAEDSSSPHGLFFRAVNGPNAGAYTFGRVKCLEVDGADAWVSGPVTRTQDGVQDGSIWVVFRIHDGKLPHGGGDRVMTFGETPADGLANCLNKVHTQYDPYLVPLIGGNVTVAAGH